MNDFNKKIIIVFVVLLLSITIGYAFLSANLNINGASTINNSTWNIYWNNVQVTSGSVSASTPVIDNIRTTVTYEVTLSKPGDFYEFTVDAENDGTIDAMIDTILSTLNNSEIQTLPSYLVYNVSYSDNTPILTKQELNAGTKETYKIRLEYKKDITTSDLPTTEQTLNLSFSVTYVQKDNTGVPIEHLTAFEADSWDTIVSNIRNNNTSNYNVGDTREVDLGSFGVHTIRIVNKSTPDDCKFTGFSQTGCGFVLEFVDIVTLRPVSTSSNIDGWGVNGVRSYINNTIYNALPEGLKNSIINTTVIYGNGAYASLLTGSVTDKMFILSAKELTGSSNGYDNADSYLRRLDYYTEVGNNESLMVKNYNNTAYSYWTRSADSSSSDEYIVISEYGHRWYADTQTNSGVVPAFRIG